MFEKLTDISLSGRHLKVHLHAPQLTLKMMRADLEANIHKYDSNWEYCIV